MVSGLRPQRESGPPEVKLENVLVQVSEEGGDACGALIATPAKRKAAASAARRIGVIVMMVEVLAIEEFVSGMLR